MRCPLATSFAYRVRCRAHVAYAALPSRGSQDLTKDTILNLLKDRFKKEIVYTCALACI